MFKWIKKKIKNYQNKKQIKKLPVWFRRKFSLDDKNYDLTDRCILSYDFSKQTERNKKIYAVNLCYYTEENVPERGAVIFVRSDKDITKMPTHIIKENIFVKEAMENNDCEGIGNIFEITEEEFYEEYPNEDLIEM